MSVASYPHLQRVNLADLWVDDLIMRKPIKPISQQLNSHDTQIWGWTFSVFGVLFFVGFFYAAVVSKLLSPSDNPILSAIQEDRYYCFLIPLSLPVLVVIIYFHWLFMKLFKHA